MAAIEHVAWPRAVVAGAVLVLVAACSSTPSRRADEPVARPPAGSYAPTPAPSSRKGGGYYLDDGPGDNPPANLELLPDAVPRVEKLASGANRPYNVFGVDYVPDLSGAPYRQRGVGSWYGRKFHGQRTSSGEIYDMYAMTAAHPTLPIPCYALVTNLQNGRSVIVRVNDRGPFLHNRVMDLSYAAAYKVGYLSSGSGMIEVEMLMPADIAAGRIPQTTTGVLLAASMPAPRTASSSAPAVVASLGPVPAASTSSPATVQTPEPLTIEALIASASTTATTAATRPPVIASSGTPSLSTPNGPTASVALPPAPTVRPDATTRSLPLAVPTDVPSSEPSGLVALPDRQPPASLPEIATAAGYYLQLGAFRVKAGADSFASHLGREIDPALASRLHVVEGNGVYRVRVGPYGQRADADTVAASLRAAIAMPILVMPEGASR